MIVVDSSVWIDFLNGHATPEVGRLSVLIGMEPLWLAISSSLKCCKGYIQRRMLSASKRHYADLTWFRCWIRNSP